MAKKFSKLSVIRQKDVLKKQSTPKIKKKTKSLLPPDTHQGIFLFWKISRALISWNIRFEICPFGLLPTT